MSEIYKNTVLNLAKLAKLSVNDGEIEKMAKNIQEIISFAGKLDRIDFDSTNLAENSYTPLDELREDIIKSSHPTDELLANSPSKTDKYISVPKTVN